MNRRIYIKSDVSYNISTHLLGAQNINAKITEATVVHTLTLVSLTNFNMGKKNIVYQMALN